MIAKPYTSLSLFVAVISLAAVLTGCGDTVDGTYTPKDGGFFEKMEFNSGGKVEISFMGATKEATYVVEDNKVKITNAGETNVFAINDKGCLDGGTLLGEYCKGTGAGTSASSSQDTGQDSDSLSGTFMASDAEGSMSFEFMGDQKVRMTTTEGGDSESADVNYSSSGDQVTISFPGGVPLVLTHKGDALEGLLEGRNIVFAKQ